MDRRISSTTPRQYISRGPDEHGRPDRGGMPPIDRLRIRGVTNGRNRARQAVPPEVKNLVERIKLETALPVCVGFGISKPEHVRMVCQAADGAVVGSWLVDLLHREWNGGKGRENVIQKVRELKTATRAR